MDNIEQQLKAFENDTNAEANIRNAITKAYGDLKPELETINTYENQQFPAFYDMFQGGDMGAAGLDPATRLANAWREAGRASTSANVARGAFDVRRAGMEDLIATAMNDYNARYGRLSDAWNRALQRAQLARMGGGGTTETPKYEFNDLNKNGVVTPEEIAAFEKLMGGTGTGPTPTTPGTTKLPAQKQGNGWMTNAYLGSLAGTALMPGVGTVAGGIIGGKYGNQIGNALSAFQKLGLKNTWNLLRNGVPQQNRQLIPNLNPRA